MSDYFLKSFWQILLSLIVLVTLISCQHMQATRSAASTTAPFKKVVLVIFENENIDKPLSQPFFKQLADEGALLTNYHAIAHPSQPNYIALTSGDTQGVIDDLTHDLDVQHLGNLLEKKGKTWKLYAENYPGNCFLGAADGRYVRKHTPFISYTNVSKTNECANIVEASQFAVDVNKKDLPDFSFYTPNMDNDTHDTNIVYGENWFKSTFGPLVGTDYFKNNVLLIVTFDENECNTVGPQVTQEKLTSCKGDTNQVYTVFHGYGVIGGSKSNTSYNHYDLLRTIEKGFGLDTLKKQDAHAAAISGVWSFGDLP